jgi:hypothetical protein
MNCCSTITELSPVVEELRLTDRSSTRLRSIASLEFIANS